MREIANSNDDDLTDIALLGPPGDYTASLEGEIAALRRSEFVVGNTPITKIPSGAKRAMWVRYRHDGRLYNRAFQSASYWRMKVRNALGMGEQLEVLEMDEWGRLKQLFPKSVVAGLTWNSQQPCDPLSVTRLYDPASDKQMLLFRSRLRGHAVDALHNFTEGGVVFQSLWVADILRLNPLLGIKLVRDLDLYSTVRMSDHLRSLRASLGLRHEPNSAQDYRRPESQQSAAR